MSLPSIVSTPNLSPDPVNLRPPIPRAKVALVGLTGYAGELCKLLQNEQCHKLGRTDLAGIHVIDPDRHGKRLDELCRDGVRSYDRFDQLLDDASIDAIWLPVPIHLHHDMAESVLRAGKTLMLEKPVAGCVADHEAIARAQRETGQPVLVGFQDLYPPKLASVKRQLLDGSLGTPKRAVVSASWPRSDAYYQRTSWAGATQRNGRAVFDSPLNNAMAHFANLALFLLGPTLNRSATVKAVEAQLWRARPIENFDTCSLKVTLGSGKNTCELIILLTHASTSELAPIVEIDTDRGTLSWCFSSRTTFRPNHGDVAPIELSPPVQPRAYMARRLGNAALGMTTDQDVDTWSDLDNSFAHTRLVEATQRAVQVVDIPEEHPEGSGPMHIRSIAGIQNMFVDAFARRQTLAELGVDLPGKPGVYRLSEDADA